MDFTECELSPELSSSAESSVEFVAEIPGQDCEEQSSTIILTDSEDGPPKPEKKLTKYFTPACQNSLHLVLRIGSTDNRWHSFPDELIINMDETPLYFDMLWSSTVMKKGV